MVNGFTFEAQQNSSNHDTRMDYWAHGMNSSRPNGVAPNSFYGIEEAHVSGSMPGWTKPPLPKRKESLAHSDSDLSAPQDDDSGSDFDVDHPSDSSDYLGSRKRKRTSQKAIPSKFQHVPQDNDMRRKLRGAAIVPSQPTSSVDLVSQHNTANGFDSAKDRVSETEDEGSSLTQEAVEADPLAVPERVVSDEQLERERTWLKTSWEFVTILDFLSTFQSRLNFGKLQFSTEELESALILNNGTSGLLVEVHLALIKGISARSGVHPGNWTSSFAEKLRSYWRLGPLEGRPPFSSQRRYEAPAYAILPLADRVSALRILCELRLEKEDLHDLVETALYPPKKTKAEKRAIEKAKQNGEKLPAEEPLLTMDDVRKEPTAKDGSGLLYWYLDYHDTTGTRLYREVPQSMLKNKAKKEAEGPEWELIATSAEDLTEVGEKLKRSKKPADQALADMILEEFVPELLQRREADLRKQRAAAKLQAQLQNIMPEGGRSRRARKVVDYSYDAFDATIKAALRTKDADLTSRVTRSNANPDFRPDAVEDLAMGRRRGRSARAASPPGELPPFKRVRKLDEDSGSYGPSAEPSRMYSGSIEPSAEPSREATPGNADVGPNRQEIEQTNGRVKEQDRTYEQTGQKLDRQYQANAEASNVQPNGHFHSIEAGRQVYNEGHGQMYIQATYPGEYAQNEPYDRTSLDYQIPGVQVQHYGNQYDTYSAYYQDPQILWGNEQMQDQYGNIIPSQYTNSLGWQAQH